MDSQVSKAISHPNEQKSLVGDRETWGVRRSCVKRQTG